MSGLREYLAGENDGPGGTSGPGRPCGRCGRPKPPGRGRRLCDSCSPRKRPHMCTECGEVEIKGSGTRYCADCKAFHLDVQRRKKTARTRARYAKPCRGCGGVKPPGRHVVYCNACARKRSQPRIVACRHCGSKPVRSKYAKLCLECWGVSYQRSLRRRARWRREHPTKPRRRSHRNRSRTMPRVPAYPLAIMVERMVRKESMLGEEDAPTVVYERLGIHPRALWGWKNGDRPMVPFDTADHVLTQADWFWWEVWTEETVRLPLFAVTTYSHQMKTTKRGVRKMFRVKTRTIPYGDAGPDLATLAEVRSAMTGEQVHAA